MRSKATRWGQLFFFVLTALLGAVAPAHATPAHPNDPAFSLQWNLEMIGAPSAWQVATGFGATVAIVDSGVDLNHEDLKGKIVGAVSCIGAAGDASKCTPGGQDDNGHGTHVAGIAAAETNNGIGVAGVAPDASILAVKVLDSTGSGDGNDVAAGIKYAADHGAAVINLSLGNFEQSLIGPSFQNALDYAFNKGALPVVAAGNNFVLPSGPITHAIVVGALDRNGSKASYSNLGTSQWVLMAPGGEVGESDSSCQSAPVGVLSTYLGGYACLAGTSMAAPHVSGAAAVLRSQGLSAQQIVDRLLATSRDLGSADGARALDLAAAVGQAPTPPPDTTPDASTTSLPPVTGGIGTGGHSSSSTPTGDAAGPSPTSPPVVSLPGSQAAAPATGRVIARSPSDKDNLSTGVVVVAVVMAGGVSVAIAWLFFRGHSWARRTPRADR